MIRVEAIGTAFGSDRVSNAELERENPSWDFRRLEHRTGVLQRPIAAADETALDLAERACRQLIEAEQLDPDRVDAIIFCTETPDHPLPPNACILHKRLGLKSNVVAFDITLACSGYVYCLMLAKSMIFSGNANTVLVVTADTYSRLIHPGDRATRVLFGDGAAVSVVGGGPTGFGIGDTVLGTAGAHYDRFIVEAGAMRVPASELTAKLVQDRSGNIRSKEHIEMDGFGVLSFFNSKVPAEIRAYLHERDLSFDDINLVVCHQASKVALEGIQRGLGLGVDKFVIDLSETGNLVSASIPIALVRGLSQNRIKPGDNVLICGFGVGLSWGTCLLEYGQ